MGDVKIDRSNVINVNVGILGHVDSGKTSLVKALSTLLSTAALDKNPQSQARGITLDLGFSAFTLPMPEHLKASAEVGKTLLQFTLVDCPGHASLIRTIIGGAQIIDMMILVVDANKGIQTQTAECIVIGEITTDKLIIVLNKIDLLPEDEREARTEKMTNRLRKVFAKTKFANSPIIATSAAVGGEKVASIGAKCATEKLAVHTEKRKDGASMNLSNTNGVAELVDLISASIEIPKRNLDGPLYYAIDHCFAIKGRGTILTGTVLSGSVSVGSIIEIPHLQIQRKVKSMQMFHKSVRTAGQGDRVGLCVTNLDPKMIERGVAVSPGSVPLLSTVICMVKKVRFFLEVCKSNSKFHISIGHTTVTATVLFYGARELAAQRLAMIAAAKAQKSSEGTGGGLSPVGDNSPLSLGANHFNFSDDSLSSSRHSVDVRVEGVEGVIDPSKERNEKEISKKIASLGRRQSALNAVYHNSFPDLQYPWDTDFEYQESLRGQDDPITGTDDNVWAVLQFQRPVFCPIGSLIIGSRLDTFATNVILEKQDKNGHKGEHASQCRLAFYGPLMEAVSVEDMGKIKVYSWKEKIGEVDQMTSYKNGLCTELIGINLIKEGGSINSFIGMKVETERGHLGLLMGPYGSGGSFRVKFSQGVPVTKGSKLVLRFKRYIHDNLKIMAQSGLDEYAEERAAIIAELLPYEVEPEEEGKKLSNRQKKAEKKELQAQKSIADNQSISLLSPSKVDLEGVTSESATDNDSPVALNTTEGILKMVPPAIMASNGNDGINLRRVIVPSAEQGASFSNSSNSSNLHLIDPVPAKGPVPSVTSLTPPRSPKPHDEVVTSSSVLSSVVTSSIVSSVVPSAVTSSSSGPLRIGVIESIKPEVGSGSAVIAIVTGAFRMEDNIRQYKDIPANIREKGVTGDLSGPWAKLGKCKVTFQSGVDVAVGDVVEMVLST